MAAKAFVLIETAVGRTKDVAANLGQLMEVASVDSVTGPYDLIAVIDGENLIEISDIVTSRIHCVRGVSRTVACLSV